MTNVRYLDDYRPQPDTPLDVFMRLFPDSEAAAEIRKMRDACALVGIRS